MIDMAFFTEGTFSLSPVYVSAVMACYIFYIYIMPSPLG